MCPPSPSESTRSARADDFTVDSVDVYPPRVASLRRRQRIKGIRWLHSRLRWCLPAPCSQPEEKTKNQRDQRLVQLFCSLRYECLVIGHNETFDWNRTQSLSYATIVFWFIVKKGQWKKSSSKLKAAANHIINKALRWKRVDDKSSHA